MKLSIQIHSIKMKHIPNIVFSLALMLSAFSVQGQKFGYVNSSEILAALPEVKQAEANIEALRKQLEKKFQQDLQSLQTAYQEAQQKVADGVLSPKQQEEEAAKLKKREDDLRKYETDSQQKLASKQQELVQPILDKVNKAIQDVAKENGYQFIFDEAVLLYRDPSLNVDKLVRAKLGIQ